MACNGIDASITIQIKEDIVIEDEYGINVLFTMDYLILKFNKHEIYYSENESLKKFLTGLPVV